MDSRGLGERMGGASCYRNLEGPDVGAASRDGGGRVVNTLVRKIGAQAVRPSRASLMTVGTLAAALAMPAGGHAQETGMSPTRVTLPTGPGSIEGLGENADVNVNMGLLGYGVAIELPAGQAGLAPSLRLSYQSGGGNDTVGLGWSFTVPSIERMTSRGLPQYGRTDRMVADGGQELVAVDVSRGVYRARYEGGFVRYTWTVATDGRDGRWRAEYPDGRVGWFGADENGRTEESAAERGVSGIFRWNLLAMTDPHGHVVRYAYRRSGGHALLDTVRYGSTDGSRYEVRLAYETRPDVISDAKSGVELRLTERVRGVTVRVRGVQLRRYDFGYEPDDVSGGTSRLRSVARFGENDVGPYPVRFQFAYSAALPCPGAGCSEPFVRTMGSVGADLRAGTTDFVDLDGDALPDALDTRGGTHQIRRNRFAADGSHGFADPVSSAVATGGAASLGPQVQLFDFDGDGFVDLLDGAGNRLLRNRGTGDWSASVSVADANLRDLSRDTNLRFVDYDGDRRTDLVHSDATTTWYYLRRADGGFVATETAGDPIGWSFATDGMRFADVNGDGLQDAVLVLNGVIAHRLSLGRGRWAPRAEFQGVPPMLPLTVTQLADVNGDGLADLLVVEADRVRYALNRAGTRFDVLREVRVAGSVAIPVRMGDTSVRLLDMNGNGSTDVVWVTPSGAVTYLELFPRRPNLLVRIENGLGRASEFTYGTSVEHMSRDGGPAAWHHRVPFGMQVVDRVDDIDTRTGVRQRTEYRYHHGYWDGDESQFRGFEAVEAVRSGDTSSEAGMERYAYDVGVDDRYRKGLVLSKTSESADRVLSVERHTYDACALAEVPTTDPPVRWFCETQMRRELREGAATSLWTTTGTDYRYDGYGNRSRVMDNGVLAVGGAACGACARDASIFGAPCGPQCLGDERLEETEYVTVARSSGRWMLRRPSIVRRRGRDGDALYSEERTYYDGEALRGLPLGELTRGDAVRVVRRLEADSAGFRDVEVTRNRVDSHGNVVETRDANGHRRTFDLDDDGILTLVERAHFDDRATPYSLAMHVTWHPLHEKVVRSEDWQVEGVSSAEAPRVTLYAWDPFSRVAAIARPGDGLEDPTEQWRYELAAPISRIVRIARSRSGSADVEEAQCFDGLGRALGKRTRLGPARWQATDWVDYDAQAHTAAKYQPWESTDGSCGAPPPSVRATAVHYDSSGREVGTNLPDAERYGGHASQTRREYEPLVERRFDEEDSDATSEHRDTPTVLRRDGLDRVVSLERTRDRSGGVVRLELRYDPLGRLRGFVDPEGNEKIQRYDLFDRVVEVTDPDSGRTLRAFDDAGNLTRETDARGSIVARTYDEANRVAAHWDSTRADATRVSYGYDLPGDCASARCSNVAGRLANVRYPLGSSAFGIDRYGYDARGFEVLRERTIDGVAYELRTLRDALGRMVGRRFPGGHGFDMVLDGLGRATSVPGYLPTLSYDARGQRSFELLANGVATSWQYDERSRLLERDTRLVGGAPLAVLGYGYDRASNIRAIEDRAPVEGVPSWAATYRYDALYRLIGAQLDAGRSAEENLTWHYDDGDDLIESTSSLGSASPAHVGPLSYGDGMTAGPHAVVRAGDLSYVYDRAGHVRQRGQVALSWDHLGRLTSANRGAELVAEYTYGPDEQRIRKREGASTTLYLANDFEIREGVSTAWLVIDGRRLSSVERIEQATWVLPDLAPGVRSGATVRSERDGRITAGDAWLAEANAAGAVSVEGAMGADPDGLLRAAAATLMAGSGGTVRFFHQDHLGTTMAATDAAGAVMNRETHYPYGLHRSVSGGSSEEYGYTDKEHDEGVELTNFGARYLDSWVGRWSMPDPSRSVLSVESLFRRKSSGSAVGKSAVLAAAVAVDSDEIDWDSFVRFGFVRNCPVNLVDADGREGKGFWQWLGNKIGSAAKAVASAVSSAVSSLFADAKTAEVDATTPSIFGGLSLGLRAFELGARRVQTEPLDPPTPDPSPAPSPAPSSSPSN